MSKKTKLTSVNILTDVYNEFKKETVGTDITLQKVVNRVLDLYCTNPEIKKMINDHETSKLKNSKY